MALLANSTACLQQMVALNHSQQLLHLERAISVVPNAFTVGIRPSFPSTFPSPPSILIVPNPNKMSDPNTSSSCLPTLLKPSQA